MRSRGPSGIRRQPEGRWGSRPARIPPGQRIRSALQVSHRGEPPGPHGVDERVVVALVLVCVRDGEARDRAIERVAAAEVGRDRDPVARARVRAGQDLARRSARRCRSWPAGSARGPPIPSSPTAGARRSRAPRRRAWWRAASRGRCRSRPASAAALRRPGGPCCRTRSCPRTARAPTRCASLHCRKSGSFMLAADEAARPRRASRRSRRRRPCGRGARSRSGRAAGGGGSGASSDTS